MHDRGSDPKHTIAVIDQLVKTGRLTDAEFRQMHHLGDSITGFRSYCGKIKSFQPNGSNRRLHDELQGMLDARGRHSQSR